MALEPPLPQTIEETENEKERTSHLAKRPHSELFHSLQLVYLRLPVFYLQAAAFFECKWSSSELVFMFLEEDPVKCPLGPYRESQNFDKGHRSCLFPSFCLLVRSTLDTSVFGLRLRLFYSLVSKVLKLSRFSSQTSQMKRFDEKRPREMLKAFQINFGKGEVQRGRYWDVSASNNNPASMTRLFCAWNFLFFISILCFYYSSRLHYLTTFRSLSLAKSLMIK